MPFVQKIREPCKRNCRDLKKQNDVVYAIAFDNAGIILADAAEGGSNGKPMLDPLASAVSTAVNENKVVSQWNEKLLDISAPVFVRGKTRRRFANRDGAQDPVGK